MSNDREVTSALAVSGVLVGLSSLAVILLRCSIGRALTALYLVPTAYTILRTGILPRWTARTAQALALWNLAFIPAMYFGSEAAVFAVGVASLRPRPVTASRPA